MENTLKPQNDPENGHFGTGEKLANVACRKARLPYHGYVNGQETNLEPLIRPFPRWNVRDADSAWCAAFVYACLLDAGFDIPYSPDECVTCSLAGCGGFEEFALGDERVGYYRADGSFRPAVGDVVIFDSVFQGKEHDHIGIVVGVEKDHLLTAEGNVPGTNTSGIVKRSLDEHVRSFIRFPDGYRYQR